MSWMFPESLGPKFAKISKMWTIFSIFLRISVLNLSLYLWYFYELRSQTFRKHSRHIKHWKKENFFYLFRIFQYMPPSWGLSFKFAVCRQNTIIWTTSLLYSSFTFPQFSRWPLLIIFSPPIKFLLWSVAHANLQISWIEIPPFFFKLR